MAAAACKVILNMMLHALADGVRTLLMTPSLRGNMSQDTANELLEEMVSGDLVSWKGMAGSGRKTKFRGLGKILVALEKSGSLDPEIWEVLRHPDTLSTSSYPVAE